VAGSAVEEDEQPGEKQQKADEQREQLVEQPPLPIAPETPRLERLSGAGVDRDVGHQKA
jgi:hypothetical protein